MTERDKREVLRQLKEVMLELRVKMGSPKSPLPQTQLAEMLGLHPYKGQSRIHTMEGGGGNSTWEKHWPIFIRLVRLCREHKISLAEEKIKHMGKH